MEEIRGPLYETEEDILNLIKYQVKESSYLEYKGCDALRKHGNQSLDRIKMEISKDVSSFANAGGGTIVYGVIDDGHIPKNIDNNRFSPQKITKEWLENVIDSNIRRKIDSIKIYQIELQITNPGKVIYSVNIPQSLQGAHQAKYKKYYQRRNFKAEPMEDYQIRDVMN